MTPDPAPPRVDAWERAAKAKGLVAAPASCGAYAKRAPARPPPKDLATALAEKDPAKRDALLAAVPPHDPERSATFLLALRADLAPVECADAMIDRALPKSAAAGGRVAHLLVGLSLAAKLARTASSPPAIAATNDKAKVKAFIQGPLRGWLVEQATAIDALAAGAARLAGYGRGVAAIEAGLADLRLVDGMRSAPTPASWDAELRQVYEAALDEALEPRKRRGRDAALVGMGDFAREGVLRDARVDRARAMLSKLYGGRRIDALDGLLVPAAPASDAPQTASAFWMNLSKEVPLDLSRGVPERVRAAARAEGRVDPAYARARFEMGRLYWRKVDFVDAAYAAAKATGDDRLVLALALALGRGAAASAADMMSAPSPAALDLVHTEALDALAAEGGPRGGMAAFDAAYLRALSPPEHGAREHLADVAARFRKAATLLGDATAKAKAEARAADADAAAKAATEKP